MSANHKDRQKHNLKYTENTPRYLFGADLSGSLKREDFVKLQSDLISDVLEMEFTRYFKSEFLSWSTIQTFQFSFLQTQNFLTFQVRWGHQTQHLRDGLLQTLALLLLHLAEEEGEDDQDGGGQVPGQVGGDLLRQLQDLLQRPFRRSRPREGHVFPRQQEQWGENVFFFDLKILRWGCLKGLIIRWARKRVL